MRLDAICWKMIYHGTCNCFSCLYVEGLNLVLTCKTCSYFMRLVFDGLDLPKFGRWGVLRLILWKSCENVTITWLRGGHHGLMVLLILENSKKMGNFGMVCAIADRSGNCRQIRHKNGLNFERLCKRPKSESDYRCERGQKRAKKGSLATSITAPWLYYEKGRVEITGACRRSVFCS